MQRAVGSDEKWPVIIHSSLQNTDIFTLLTTTHKGRGINIFQFIVVLFFSEFSACFAYQSNIAMKLS